MSDEPANPDATFAHLARLTLLQTTGEGLALNRARPELLDAQTAAVTTVLAGVFTRIVTGDHGIYDAEQLSQVLQAVANAVALGRAGV